MDQLLQGARRLPLYALGKILIRLSFLTPLESETVLQQARALNALRDERAWRQVHLGRAVLKGVE